MTSASPLLRTSLPHQIRNQLLERIMLGTLLPGNRLIELKLADSYRPIIEAISAGDIDKAPAVAKEHVLLNRPDLETASQ